MRIGANRPCGWRFSNMAATSSRVEPARVLQLLAVDDDLARRGAGEAADHQRRGKRPGLRGDIAHLVADDARSPRGSRAAPPPRPSRRAPESRRAPNTCLSGKRACRPSRHRSPSTASMMTTGSVRGKCWVLQASHSRRQPAAATRVGAPQLAQKPWRACQCAIALAWPRIATVCRSDEPLHGDGAHVDRLEIVAAGHDSSRPVEEAVAAVGALLDRRVGQQRARNSGAPAASSPSRISTRAGPSASASAERQERLRGRRAPRIGMSRAISDEAGVGPGAQARPRKSASSRRAGDAVERRRRRRRSRRRGCLEKGVFHRSTPDWPSPRRPDYIAVPRTAKGQRSKPDGGPHDKTQRAARRAARCWPRACAPARAEEVEAHGLSAFGDLALPPDFKSLRLCQPERAQGRPAVAADHQRPPATRISRPSTRSTSSPRRATARRA